MLSILDEVKQKVPKDLNLENLRNFLESAENYSADSEFEIDSGSAKEFGDLLESLFNKFNVELKNAPELEERARKLLAKVKWLNPFSLDTNWLTPLLSANLVSAIRNEWNPYQKIQNWLYFHEAGLEPNKELRAEAIASLIKNNEIIGAGGKIDLVTRESVAPVVGNWIRDYLSSLPPNSDLSGSFDKVKYLTNNGNVKRLNDDDKKVLSNVLDIYRFLKSSNESLYNGVAEYQPRESAPVIKNSPLPNKLPINPQPTVSVKPKNEFEEKLSQAAAPAHGQSLEVLKHKLELGGAGFAPEPQVSAPVEIKPMPSAPSAVKMTPEEIKRETTAKELPAPPAAPKSVPIPLTIQTKPVSMPSFKPSSVDRVPQWTTAAPKLTPRAERPLSPLSSLNDVKVMDDLKKIEISHLHQGNPATQAEMIKSKIINLARANKVLPYYAVIAFEASPLFKAYLNLGTAKLSDTAAVGELSQEEFEAVADLRKEIERL